VKLDVTVEKDGYVADAARTVLAEGGSAKATRLRVRDGRVPGFTRVARAGNRVSEIGRVVEDEVRRQFSVIRGLCRSRRGSSHSRSAIRTQLLRAATD
jgi:methionyl aminopeptidase